MFGTKFRTKDRSVLIAALLFVWSGSTFASGGRSPSPTPPPAQPPAPVLVSPANGASLVQPINLSWNAPPSTVGPIGSYTWQVSTSSTFTTVVASGFTNQEADPSIPIRTFDKVSGLANGTYFWRVKASESTNNGGVDSRLVDTAKFCCNRAGACTGHADDHDAGEQRAVSRD